MKAKSKKFPTPHSNSVKKFPTRNKSHPSHESLLERFFNQMKSDIINEIKKVTEVKLDEHKVNFLRILNRSDIISKKNEVKKVSKANKSEKKEKKNKTKFFTDEDGSIIVLGSENSLVKSKTKDKEKALPQGKNKRSKKVTPKPSRKTKTPSKIDKNVIHLVESPKSVSTEPKLSKKGKIKKSNNSDNVELIGKKRKRGKENFVDLSKTEPNVSINDKKKKSNTKSQKRPSMKKKAK